MPEKIASITPEQPPINSTHRQLEDLRNQIDSIKQCAVEITENSEQIPEVVTNLQLIPVNVRAIIMGNKPNLLGRELKKMNINPNLLESASELFRSGIGDYESFQKQVKKLDSTGNIKKATEILARCAIGKYQIIPRFHFDKIEGWKKGGTEEKLKIIYNFLRSEESQDEFAKTIIDGLGQNCEWDPYVMASKYYGGYRAKNKMKKYREAIKNGKIGNNASLKEREAYGYTSVMDYVNKIVNNMQKYANELGDFIDLNKVPPEIDKIRTYFQMAIAEKESGHLKGRTVKGEYLSQI